MNWIYISLPLAVRRVFNNSFNYFMKMQKTNFPVFTSRLIIF